MSILIADTAVVDPRAELADEVEIGPYCVVGPNTRIGRGTTLIAHVCVLSGTTLGAGNTISPFVVLGGAPDDPSHQDVPTRLEIGDHNMIRESVSIQRAGTNGERVTKIGNRNQILAGVRIGFDAWVEDHVLMGANAILGDHVHVESHARLSSGVGVHRYATVGMLSFAGEHARILHDVPRYLLVEGNPAKPRCLNIVGLKRRGLSSKTIEALHETYRLIVRAKMGVDQAAAVLRAHGHLTAEASQLLEGLTAQQLGKHGRARERLRRGILESGASSSDEAE